MAPREEAEGVLAEDFFIMNIQRGGHYMDKHCRQATKWGGDVSGNGLELSGNEGVIVHVCGQIAAA